ncbi:CIC11C00000004796 [Sungouiella intermedia]|uniref:CIC11C00000004796 n=1 Tax=Sungouiella intermedia TaxID=45354 RepID=A0A1L0DS69_9ASCO|nr:CIC11C00000004796 [[Candida] intermedia]
MATLWRRLYHANHFSASPLNYESLSRRCAQFRSSKAPTSAAIRDYILANRMLQKINRQQNPRFSLPGSALIDLDLHLHVPSAQLEQELWLFLQEYWHMSMTDEAIVKDYVLSCTSGDITHGFHLVTENYNYNLAEGRIARGPVLALIHVLLHRSDYHGCFKLLNLTFGSKNLKALERRAYYQTIAVGALVSVVAGALQCAFMTPYWAVSFLTLDMGAIFGTMYGLNRIHYSDLLGRVSWRPYTSIFYRYIHRQEILVINKIVTYFEDYNEVNVKNYHISEVRNTTNLGTFHQNEYEFQLPDSMALTWDSIGTDQKVQSTARYFRSELSKRRLLWKSLDEERMFIDFWLSHGENFEWVEPDQDPAEMVDFR